MSAASLDPNAVAQDDTFLTSLTSAILNTAQRVYMSSFD